MGRIRGKNTTPEHIVRKLMHAMGFRFRLHLKELPGKPDIVLPRHQAVVFVNGCYWHRHDDCVRGRSVPGTNTAFWLEKFRKNVMRDRLAVQALEKAGWKVIMVWECETKPSNRALLEKTLAEKMRHGEDA